MNKRISNKKMKRTQVYLTMPEIKKIKKQAYDRGVSKSEMIRRIIDKYFEED